MLGDAVVYGIYSFVVTTLSALGIATVVLGRRPWPRRRVVIQYETEAGDVSMPPSTTEEVPRLVDAAGEAASAAAHADQMAGATLRPRDGDGDEPAREGLGVVRLTILRRLGHQLCLWSDPHSWRAHCRCSAVGLIM